MSFPVKFILITFITVCVFFIESLIHFSIGKSTVIQPHKKINVFNMLILHIPDKDEIFKIIVTLIIFSLISGLLSSFIIHYHIN